MGNEAKESRVNSDSDQLIDEMGLRVRGLRARRGMTRKSLSAHSGVSERYLANLESGSANVTLSVLAKIADAFDIELQQLISDSTNDYIHPDLCNLICGLSAHDQARALDILSIAFAKTVEHKVGVALLGLRGAGKTTLGALLADRLGLQFVRLTQLIETLAEMSVGEIFDLGGQKQFRRVEQQALQQVISRNEPVILEVGGSLVSQTETYNLLLDRFHTVWIQASPEEHLARVLSQGDTRPVAGARQALDDLQLILDERQRDYGRAEFQLNTSGRLIDDCVDELVKQLPALG
jgi:XRE family aerobic/anaerobic benzoate catabolism transcriptional regulator